MLYIIILYIYIYIYISPNYTYSISSNKIPINLKKFPPGYNGVNTPLSTEFLDSDFKIIDDTEPTKEIQFELEAITAGQLRTINVPDNNINLGNIPTDENLRLFGNMSSTGAIYFGGFSINTDTTKFDIGTIKGWIIDNITDPENPSASYINYTGTTAVTPTYLATNPVTYVGIDINSTIIQK